MQQLVKQYLIFKKNHKLEHTKNTVMLLDVFMFCSLMFKILELFLYKYIQSSLIPLNTTQYSINSVTWMYQNLFNPSSRILTLFQYSKSILQYISSNTYVKNMLNNSRGGIAGSEQFLIDAAILSFTVVVAIFAPTSNV